MLWLQAALCFCVWVGYGVWFARSPYVARIKAARSKSLALGPAFLILGMVLLTGALFLVGSVGGVSGGSLTAWAWAVVLVTGIAFVHLQSLGALLIVKSALRPETTTEHQTSVRKEISND